MQEQHISSNQNNVCLHSHNFFRFNKFKTELFCDSTPIILYSNLFFKYHINNKSFIVASA